MSELRIITNHQSRLMLYGYELTEKQKKNFDYIESDEFESHNFVQYKDNIYDIGEFMRIDNIPEFKKWDGYASDSFFSGILIKFDSEDSDRVIMGWYLS